MAAAASLRTDVLLCMSLCLSSEIPSFARAGPGSSLEQDVSVKRSSTWTSSSSPPFWSFSIILGTSWRSSRAPARQEMAHQCCTMRMRPLQLDFFICPSSIPSSHQAMLQKQSKSARLNEYGRSFDQHTFRQQTEAVQHLVNVSSAGPGVF